MSDAGRKMDVEDVLSSIRRLVSEEARTVIDETIPKKASITKILEEPAYEPPEKLVLTPAFRVSDLMQSPEPVVAEVPQAPIAEDVSLKEEPEFTPQPVEAAPVIEAPFTELYEPEATRGVEPEIEIADELTMAPVTEIEPDIEVEEADLEAEVAVAEAEFIELAEVFETSEEIEAEQGIEIESPALEEVIIPPEEEATGEPQSGYAPIDYTAESDSYLDEEALRELVSEMVRSELQGELGDRITRNVRKLVRREIHRALASRDFE